MVVLLVAEGYGQVVCVRVYYLRVVSMFFFDKRIERRKGRRLCEAARHQILVSPLVCVCCEKQHREEEEGLRDSAPTFGIGAR